MAVAAAGDLACAREAVRARIGRIAIPVITSLSYRRIEMAIATERPRTVSITAL
jgi:hypothetical protein